MQRDPAIAFRHALAARTFQALYPTLQKWFFADPALEFAPKTIAAPSTVNIPTRHGEIEALLFQPTDEDLAAQRKRGETPPMHLCTHGGAYITRYPIEEGNVARYLASEVGCFVLVPHYHAAPQVRHPVAEEECFDAYKWILANATSRGWDAQRVSVGGPSAGGTLCLAVALMAIDEGVKPLPVAVSHEYGVADMSRTDEQRPSTKKNPIVGPSLMHLVRNTYAKDIDHKGKYMSPIYHPRLASLPPTLVITAEYDTLKHEANDLANVLRQAGVEVTHREFAGVDHGFVHQKPVEPAREAIVLIAQHLQRAFDRALDQVSLLPRFMARERAKLSARYQQRRAGGARY